MAIKNQIRDNATLRFVYVIDSLVLDTTTNRI